MEEEEGEKKQLKKAAAEGGETVTKSKRKMKTASQLQILEQTYAVETYPSEALRAELSVQLGLSDRQLQMWFCHRRLKDRKAPPQPKDSSPAPPPGPPLPPPREEIVAGGDGGSEFPSGSSSGLTPFRHRMDPPRRVPGRTPGVAVPRISADVQAMKRYYEPQHSITELRAIAFVEAQLGEPLREDGPILGMEFDPLPPDAFGAPIGTAAVGRQKQHGRPFEANLYDRPDVKPIKAHGTTRALHEYQFLPQQPSIKADTYERFASPYQYGSPADGHNSKTSGLSSVRPFSLAHEHLSTGYGFPSQVPSLNIMPQEGREGHILPTATGEYETVPRKSSFTNIMDAQLSTHPLTALENPFISSDKRVSHDEDVLRMERKRKSEEVRIAREVEAHEKRIRKELEKQDILRRKREEQIKKEMERLDRERRKEEERLMREKQREEERYLREQRREMERREKFLQKESIRAEKMRQKEELRREKEAARQKAASERAVARRIAKESMELVEDERLELMELAASSNGLPSILSLDFETLQKLDLFRDKLSVFPPKSVLLKKPFPIDPWKDSEENIGNLLMVWRFLITFADVLGIWPFTLDEFVQALHDYDPRLLGEIHIALFRTIIKDIEDVARTPATGLGANQNSAANPGGGHPEIVEGAYAWGFNIRNWQCHLNPLTWPEILRQFALSAGFGPQLKKRNVEQACRDENEGNDGEDVIINLRSGAAVENAVAKMHERGLSNPRRSRHRLTPGTVKFAAFHVLSLEGSKGLTILEVADKIQKSGLRDLTTSKTPEASISAALSRDSKLFERTAPSTYCVRSAYRKDPADATSILSAARERIRIFRSGIVDGEDADDAERDDDSDSDVAEDPEVDDLGNDLNLKKEADSSPEANKFSAKTKLGNGKEKDGFMKTSQVSLQNSVEGISSMRSFDKVNGLGSSNDRSADVTRPCNVLDQEDADIDESNPGELWVQGLMEGEYSDMSVEERLNALVALIGVAIEGNSIRVVLEERLEAANALKKQMWAEAQLDKRRMKEEYVMRMHYSSYGGNRMESNFAAPTAEGMPSPLVTIDEKSNGISVNATVQQEQLSDMQNSVNCLNISNEGNLQMQDFSADPENPPYQQQGHAVEKSRSQLKSFVGHKAEEMYVYRSLPLGHDRRHNRYWQFITSVSHNDPGCGRIFVELHDGYWKLIDSEEGFDALLASLDVRGVRECHLHTMLQKIEMSFKGTIRRIKLQANLKGKSGDVFKEEAIEKLPGHDHGTILYSPRSTICIANCDASETSTSFAIEIGKTENEKNHVLERYEDFENWMWKECLNSSVLCGMKYGKKRCTELLGACDKCHDIYFFEDNKCPCHNIHETTGINLNSKHMVHCEGKLKMESASTLHSPASPLRIRLLKLQLGLIEASILPEAFKPVWTNDYRKSWGMKLRSSSSAEDLLQLLTLLEAAIERDYLSSNFETTTELLGLSDSSGRAVNDTSNTQKVSVLPWLPPTTAAVALRVMEFDASISYMLHQKMESLYNGGDKEFMKLPSKCAFLKNSQDNEMTQTHQGSLFKEENCDDLGVGLAGTSRGRVSQGRGVRSRIRGGRSQRKVTGSRSVSGKRSMTRNKGVSANSDRLGQVLAWKRQSRGQGVRKRGRRSARSKQKSVKKAVEVVAEQDIPKEIIYEKSPPRGFARNEWNDNETRFHAEQAENASSSERSEPSNGQATGDEYDDDLAIDDYASGFNEKSDDLLEGSDYNVDPNIDYEYLEEDEDEQVHLDMEQYTNLESEEEGLKDEEGEQNEEADEGIESTSSSSSSSSSSSEFSE